MTARPHPHPWAQRAASSMAAARAKALARTGRLVSKVEAGDMDDTKPAVRAATIQHRGGGADVDAAAARAYVDRVEAEVRERLGRIAPADDAGRGRTASPDS